MTDSYPIGVYEKQPAVHLTEDQWQFLTALWDVCVSNTHPGHLQKNPLESLLMPGGEFFEKWQSQLRKIRSLPRTAYPARGESLSELKFRLLRDWADEFRFGGTDWLLQYLEHYLPNWYFRDGEVQDGKRDSYNFAKSDARKPPPLYPPMTSLFPVRPRLRGETSRDHKRALKREFERFRDEHIGTGKRKPAKSVVRGKRGRKLEPWHYVALALRFCGLRWKEVQAMLPFSVSESAVRWGAREAAQRLGLQLPRFSKATLKNALSE